MSSASPYESDSAATSPQPIGARFVNEFCVPAVQFVGFWAAVLLPFVLVGLLANGAVVERPSLAGSLLGANLVALVLGQGYNR